MTTARTMNPSLLDTALPLSKPQWECPICHFKHNHSAVICDLCQQFQPNLCAAWTAQKKNKDQLHVQPQPMVETSLPKEPPVEQCPTPLAAPDSLETVSPDIPQLAQAAHLHHSQGHICRVCVHPHCLDIEQGIVLENPSQRKLALQYNVSPRHISNHRLICMELPPHSKRDAAKKGGAQTSQLLVCKLCQHPDIDAINAKIHGGIPSAALEREYHRHAIPFSDKLVATHRRKCLELLPIPSGNHSGNVRGRDAALAAQSREQPLFVHHVAGEIERLVAEREKLAAESAVLAERLAHIDQQYVALRAYEEVRLAIDPGK